MLFFIKINYSIFLTMTKEKKSQQKPENKNKKNMVEPEKKQVEKNKFSRFSYKLGFNKLTRLVAILLILTTIVVSYFSYIRYEILIERVEDEVAISANQVENVFVDYANISEMLLIHLNHQMQFNDDIFRNNSKIAQVLTTFNQDTKVINSLGNNFISGAMFYWVDNRKNLIASSSGLVSKAIDLSSRDYLQKTQNNPMRLQIGSPVIGALSGQSIIPMALGVYNQQGVYAGSIVLSLRLDNFLQKFRNLKERNIEFAIIDSNNKMIMSSSEEFFRKNQKIYTENNWQNSGKILHSFSLFNFNGHVIFAKDIDNQPYKILTAMRSKNAYKTVCREMLPSFIELSLIVIFLVMIKIIYSLLLIKRNN